MCYILFHKQDKFGRERERVCFNSKIVSSDWKYCIYYIISYVCVTGHVLYSKCNENFNFFMCLTFQEIPRNILCKILCSQYGSSFNSSLSKEITNYQVCILNIRKSFCNYHIVPCIEKHSRYFVGKSCIHVLLLHIL